MSTAQDWAKGYARQACADFDTWEFLKDRASIPTCHKLLFLQMACEKLTKAHLCLAGSNPRDLQRSHAYIAGNLSLILERQIARRGANLRSTRSVIQYAKHVAREIEMLAPAVKRGGQRPDNCEYPWEDDQGRLHVPLDWTFAPSSLLTAPAGRAFLKLVREAIEQML